MKQELTDPREKNQTTEAETDPILAPELGNSSRLREIYTQIKRVARLECPVLIQAEPGLDKELVAMRIHAFSRRSDGPFASVHCDSRSPDVVARELFGYQSPCPHGHAPDSEIGKIEATKGGTLFIEGVEDLSRSLQNQILHLLDRNEVWRVGGTTTVRTDVRILAGASIDLEPFVRTGLLRPELYHRLNVILLELPPLRQRPEDILFLARCFAQAKTALLGKRACGIAEEACQALVSYSWPRNIQELRNVIEHAVVLAGDEVTPLHLPTITNSCRVRTFEKSPRLFPLGSGCKPGATAPPRRRPLGSPTPRGAL